MSRTKESVSGRSQFDDFLYAHIDEDAEEVPLSVLSALSRADLDPWAEAEALAKLPKQTAISRLATSIAATDKKVSPGDAQAIAARLIVLLHDRVEPSNVWRQALTGTRLTPVSRALRYAIVLILMLSVQWMVASCEPLMQLFHRSAPTSTRVSPAQARSDSDDSR